uniref:Uncharacterized protein n=1 Tax=Anguilla anguilla TaxID=7936 RepID=A0A0E9UIF9_ANGAN
MPVFGPSLVRHKKCNLLKIGYVKRCTQTIFNTDVFPLL